MLRIDAIALSATGSGSRSSIEENVLFVIARMNLKILAGSFPTQLNKYLLGVLDNKAIQKNQNQYDLALKMENKK